MMILYNTSTGKGCRLLRDAGDFDGKSKQGKLQVVTMTVVVPSFPMLTTQRIAFTDLCLNGQLVPLTKGAINQCEIGKLEAQGLLVEKFASKSIHSFHIPKPPSRIHSNT
jgi:hypothetical protein